MQGWLSTDPESQHEITQLRQQLVELRQRLEDEPTEAATPPRTGQQSSSSQMTPIQRSLQGAGAPPGPPPFDPACLLTVPGQSNPWLNANTRSGLANRTFTT